MHWLQPSGGPEKEVGLELEYKDCRGFIGNTFQMA